MLNIRIVTAGAIFSAFSLVSGLTVSGAEAQTAPTETAGKPIQLLQLLQPSKAKTKPQAKLAAKPAGKTRTASRSRTRSHGIHSVVAARKRFHARTQIAQAPAPDSAWPAASSAAPTEVAAAAPIPPQPVAAPTEAAAGALVVGGHTVQLVSPNDANEIDLAANDAGARVSAAPPDNAVASTPAIRDIIEAQPKSDSVRVATAQQPGREVGSTSWVLQVLAALGGAVAAGSVAWFLIGAAPQRTYG